jgi:hypothetical protein
MFHCHYMLYMIQMILYEDETLTTPTEAGFDASCTIAGDFLTICDYYLTVKDYGVVSHFGGLVHSIADPNYPDLFAIGDYVFSGGGTIQAGIIGTVFTMFKQGVTQHNICVQGSVPLDDETQSPYSF